MRRVLIFGATGTIGQAAVRAFAEAGWDVTCFVRGAAPSGARSIRGDVRDAEAVSRAFAGAPYEAVVSCLASRTGAPKDAWAIDHQATVNVIKAARAAEVGHFILLSAICVQKPKLVFQHAKLAAEAVLAASGLRYSIVRPTAYFKSLSGQIKRVQAGKPYLLFGDGRGTACKPISDMDLGRYILACVGDAGCFDRILPIGGAGPAITPRDQGEALFALIGQSARFRQVPVGLMDAIGGGLGALGCVLPGLAEKAELARIAKYYATESMLVWDEAAGAYDAAATPETGSETLFDHYEQVLTGAVHVDLGAHKVF